MSIICLNCKTSLGCSCQKRTASDGKSVCQTCIAAYESALLTGQPQQKVAEQLKEITVPVTNENTVPNNVKVLYRGPGKQI